MVSPSFFLRPSLWKQARRRKNHRTLRVERLEDRTLLATFAVTSTADSGPGSLREAILDANHAPGADQIEFNIPTSDPHFVDVDSQLPGGDPDADVFLIQPLSPLPELNDPSGGTTIDGRTQAQFVGRETNPVGPEIVLDGQRDHLSGIRLFSDGNRVIGLNIQRFANDGVLIRTGSENVVEGNFLGTDPTGTIAAANFRNGVTIKDGAQGNIIGTNGDGQGDAVERNVISGNVRHGVSVSSDGNIIAGNYIGIDVSGTKALGNGQRGINLVAGSTRIGTDGNGLADGLEGNIISANGTSGILIHGSHTTIAGNFIGTDATGTVALGNGAGIHIALGSTDNVVGTNGDGIADTDERNIISSNGEGVLIDGVGADANVIAGNFIGTDVTGSISLGNTGPGIRIRSGAKSNVVGTDGDGLSDEQERNIISGNTTEVTIDGLGTDSNKIAGNFIGTDVTGSVDLDQTGVGVWIRSGAKSNILGTNGDGVSDSQERNVIAGNLSGILIEGPGTDANIVAGNYVGTDASGATSLGNDGPGVQIRGGPISNLIGTNGDGLSDAQEGNIISGNAEGVIIDGRGTDSNVIAGNHIGTDVAGRFALGNAGPAVAIRGGAQSNLLGTNGDGLSDAQERNVISGNGRGVVIEDIGTAFNNVAGNHIGVDAAGSQPLPNSHAGVVVASGPQSNRIGTDSDGIGDLAERNVISANALSGIILLGASTKGNVVAGNFIGTDATGTFGLGNARHGVLVVSSLDNRIGTDSDGVADLAERNVISANGGNGVQLSGSATGNALAGNLIGTDATGAIALGNAENGVRIVNSSQNRIGLESSSRGDGSTIAFNALDGVRVIGDTATENPIRGNSIHSNGGLGINLVGGVENSAGVTANDGFSDADEGPNGLQNMPFLYRFEAGQNPTVVGIVDGQGFLIDVYANRSRDASGFGEGQRYLGSFVEIGSQPFERVLTTRLEVDEFMTATATDGNGNTSEFSGIVRLTIPDLELNEGTSIDVPFLVADPRLPAPQIQTHLSGTADATAFIDNANQLVVVARDEGDSAGTINVSAGTFDVETTFNLAVKNVPPTVDRVGLGERAVLRYKVGQKARPNIQVTDPGIDKMTVFIDWGDGSMTKIEDFAGGKVPATDAEKVYGQPGNFELKVWAVDEDNGMSQVAIRRVRVSGEPNSPPVIEPIPNQVLDEGQTVQLALNVSDADNDQLELTTQITGSTAVNAFVNQQGELVITSEDEGDAMVTVEVSDGIDTTTTTFSLAVVNLPPVIQSFGPRSWEE